MTPRHQPQLTGIATQATDCGVSSTSMAIDFATRGARRPSVPELRKRMGKPAGTTNPVDWARAIESFDTARELDGRYERLTGRTLIAAGWEPVSQHLKAGRLAIVAVDYGVWRKLLPRKSGSTSFDGYHAIPVVRLRDGSVTSYDPLLDGRYRGCPKGPVRVPLDAVRQAAQAIGRREAGSPSVYAYLIDRATRLGDGVDIPDPSDDEEAPTLSGVLADLYEAADVLLSGTAHARVSDAIDALEAIIGPYDGPATPDQQPDPGVTP